MLRTAVETVAEATDILENAFSAIGSYGGGNTEVPRAYLNYILFDEYFNFVRAGFDRIESASGFDVLGGPAMAQTISNNGYIYIWVSNETENSEVWFDDLMVTHKKHPIVQVDDYYPFGLTMKNSTYERKKERKWNLYNGKELQEELDLGLYDYGFRYFDPALGRWNVQEPFANFMVGISPYAYAYNSPINYKDLLGLYPGGNDNNKPDYLKSVFDTSADQNGDGYVTPYEREYYDRGKDKPFKSLSEDEQKNKDNDSFKLTVNGKRVTDPDREILRITDGKYTHIFYASYFMPNKERSEPEPTDPAKEEDSKNKSSTNIEEDPYHPSNRINKEEEPIWYWITEQLKKHLSLNDQAEEDWNSLFGTRKQRDAFGSGGTSGLEWLIDKIKVIKVPRGSSPSPVLGPVWIPPNYYSDPPYGPIKWE